MATDNRSSDFNITEVENFLRSFSRQQVEASIERLVVQARLAVSRLQRNEHYHKLRELVEHA